MTIKKKIISSFIGSGAAAGLNMLTTIIILRWFGEETFTTYLISLSYIALSTILLEIVPGNYSVFKLQDTPSFIKPFALFSLIISIVNFLIIYFLTYTTNIFSNEGIFLAAYAALLSIKRYFDVKFQADGLVSTFFLLEFLIALTKLIFIYIIHAFNLGASSIWIALSASIAIPYAGWLILNKREINFFLTSINRCSLEQILHNKKNYYPYYLGTTIKRLKDNIITISSPIYLGHHQDLANFLLAYRGLVFAVGQLRVIEAILNNKLILAAAEVVKKTHVYTVAFCAQIGCVCATLTMMYLSNTQSYNLNTILILSCTCWIYVFFTRVRAKALSEYQQNIINIAYSGHSIALLAMMAFSHHMNYSSSELLALFTFLAELLSCTLIVLFMKRKSC